MINNYTQITNKYLKANRKRTILTIVGIILSVALIASIGLFFKGLEASNIEFAKKTYGSYHLAFKNIEEDTVSKIQNNPKVSRSGLFQYGEGVQLSEKLSTTVISATGKALELLPVNLKEGRLPENASEIAAERWILKYIDDNVRVNENVKINNKEYKLVGILDDNISTQMNKSGLILTKNDNISIKNSTLLVEINSKANIKAGVEELKALVPKEKVEENTYLLSLQGAGDRSTNTSMYVTIGIIISIVVIVTIALIYNAFQISVVERIKQFGLLRAIGATPKQIRKIVLKEASLMAVIGVPIGLISGVVAIYGICLTFKLIGGNSVNFILFNISPYVLLISGIVGLLAIYASALLPAFFAGRISPLTAISSRSFIKKEKIKRRKHRLVSKFLGFEGVLAFKNINRNRKRYRITVFSIVISVMLFITFKSFMDMGINMNKSINETSKINYSIAAGKGTDYETSFIDNSVIKRIQDLNSVEKVYKTYKNYSFLAAMDSSRQNKDVAAMGNIYTNINYKGKLKTQLNASINIYDPQALEDSKKYLQAGSIDVEQLNAEDGVIVIDKNAIYNQKKNKTYIGTVTEIKPGDELLLQNYQAEKEEGSTFGSKEVKSVKVLATLREEAFDYKGDSAGLKIITTEAVAKKLLNTDAVKPTGLDIKIKNLNLEEIATAQLEQSIKDSPSLSVINIIDQNKSSKSSILMVRILLYGFVVVVSLIGSVNIINTLTTNIILRRREFAALKSIGLTQRGLKKIIVIEGLQYGVVGAFYGSIVGCLFSYLLFRSMNGIRQFPWPVPWNAMIIASLCAIGIGYISILSPLRRVNRDNLIDTIREE